MNLRLSNSSRLLIPVLGILSALVAMALDMYLPALPQIAEDLQADHGLVQQSVSVFLVGIACSQLFYGPLSDRFGRQRLLLAGTLIFTVASALCMSVSNVNQLISLRLLQAVGAGAGGVMVATIVRDLYQGEQAARAMSYVVGVMMIVPLLAPIVGGYVLAWFGWRANFAVLVFLGAICTTAVLLVVPETLPPQYRRSLAWSSISSAYAGVLRDKRAMGFNLSASFSYGCLFSFAAGSPYVYIEYFGVPAQHFGYLFGCNIIAALAGSILNARLVGRFSSQALLMTAVSIQLLGAALLMLSSYIEVGGVLTIVIPAMITVGMAAAINANSTAIILSRFPQVAGTASGVVSVSRFGIAGIASGAVGYFHNGTILVMPAVMLSCSLISFTALVLIMGMQARSSP